MRIVRSISVGVAVGSLVLVTSPVAGPASAGAVDCQQTFTSLGEVVPGNTQHTLALPVVAEGTVADVDVRLWGDVTEAGFILGRESVGTIVELDSFGLATLDGASFDDEATATRPPDQAIYAGRYQPQDPLSGFDGLPVTDTWQLVVTNTAFDSFALSPWQLTITFADCEPDTDSDGVPDESDQCPTVPFDAPSGCPVIARKLTFGWSDGAWRGRLTADRAPCHRERPVRVLRVDAGADTRVATGTTRRDGTWTDGSARPRGTFYALAPRVLVPGVGICAKSRTPNKTF